jgi:hypothetical protein
MLLRQYCVHDYTDEAIRVLLPTGLMTSQQVNDELMSRRVCNYQYGMVFYPITPGTGAPCHYTSYNTWLSPSFLLYIQLLFSIAIATAGITIIPNSHLNGLDSSRQGTTRNGCTLNRACVGPAKLRSTEIAENRISGKNAKSLWLARLGYSNLPVKIFARGRSVYIRVPSPVQKSEGRLNNSLPHYSESSVISFRAIRKDQFSP